MFKEVLLFVGGPVLQVARFRNSWILFRGRNFRNSREGFSNEFIAFKASFSPIDGSTQLKDFLNTALHRFGDSPIYMIYEVLWKARRIRGCICCVCTANTSLTVSGNNPSRCFSVTLGYSTIVPAELCITVLQHSRTLMFLLMGWRSMVGPGSASGKSFEKVAGSIALQQAHFAEWLGCKEFSEHRNDET